MSGVGTGEGIDDVERIEPVQMRDDLRAQAVEPLLRESLVDVTPPDPVFRAGLDDDELVLGERPVCLPVSTTRGPPCASAPSPRLNASV